MTIITLEDVTYRYSPDTPRVLRDVTVEVPSGMTSLTGPNGIGKTTFMLVAGARLAPNQGAVTILGQPASELDDEATRNLVVSFVYQNMEFETEHPVGDLLGEVYAAGVKRAPFESLRADLVRALDLEPILKRSTAVLSKGEMQRAILAFSLLYGSPILMMDEPVFAMEPGQKIKAFEFLRDYSSTHGVSVLFSAHELELNAGFSDHHLLFYKDRRVELSPETPTAETLEEVFGVPHAMLHKKETLYRDNLIELSEQIRRRGGDQG